MAANDNSKQSLGTETINTKLESAKLDDPVEHQLKLMGADHIVEVLVTLEVLLNDMKGCKEIKEQSQTELATDVTDTPRN